ncbi:RNA polymerase II-associated [Chlamydoabsidia padenii]|nr:RNA polymerase II-associated [Chlamydoabsidia padenii]
MASKSDFICRVRYRNRLPPIPFPPKLLATESLAERNVKYTTNSLIEQTPHLLTLDSSSSIPFDKLLVDYLDMMETNPDVTRVNPIVAEEDKLLMTPPRDEKELGKQQGRQPNVTWLRRSEYIASGERKTKLSSSSSSTEIRSKLTQQDLEAHTYRTYASQIAGVESTFASHDLNTLRHPRTKRRAKTLTPILPDMKCWETVYTIGQFPADPADNHRLNKRKRQDTTSSSSKQPSELDAADRGILRPISNPHDANDSYLIWFLPDDTSASILKRQKTDVQNVLDQHLNFEAVRDYTYRNDNAPGHQNLLLTLAYDDHQRPVMHYNLVKSKLVAQKKRALARGYRNMDDYEKPNVLSVTYQ